MKMSKLDKALQVAAIAHADQKRKGTSIPYIIHPVGVMLAAKTVTADEDTLCACLLHDVLEDGDPKVYGEQDMLRDFGPAITNTVKDVSKNPSIKGWQQRNEAYIAHLLASNNEAAFIVCAADKVHNLRSVLIDHASIGDEIWKRFNASKEGQKWWYQAVLNLLEQKLSGNALVAELRSLVGQLHEL